MAGAKLDSEVDDRELQCGLRRVARLQRIEAPNDVGEEMEKLGSPACTGMGRGRMKSRRPAHRLSPCDSSAGGGHRRPQG